MEIVNFKRIPMATITRKRSGNHCSAITKGNGKSQVINSQVKSQHLSGWEEMKSESMSGNQVNMSGHNAPKEEVKFRKAFPSQAIFCDGVI